MPADGIKRYSHAWNGISACPVSKGSSSQIYTRYPSMRKSGKQNPNLPNLNRKFIDPRLAVSDDFFCTFDIVKVDLLKRSICICIRISGLSVVFAMASAAGRVWTIFNGISWVGLR